MINGTAKRLTLAEAATLQPDEWDGSGADGPGLQMQDLAITCAELVRLARVWSWLVGVCPYSPEAAAVGNEVLTDGQLMVALSLPGVEFLDWWRRQDWDTLGSTERTGSIGWAWVVLDRARVACAELGALASQRALSAP